jgi:hypothetical protein
MVHANAYHDDPIHHGRVYRRLDSRKMAASILWDRDLAFLALPKRFPSGLEEKKHY